MLKKNIPNLTEYGNIKGMRRSGVKWTNGCPIYTHWNLEIRIRSKQLVLKWDVVNTMRLKNLLKCILLDSVHPSHFSFRKGNEILRFQWAFTGQAAVHFPALLILVTFRGLTSFHNTFGFFPTFHFFQRVSTLINCISSLV